MPEESGSLHLRKLYLKENQTHHAEVILLPPENFGIPGGSLIANLGA